MGLSKVEFQKKLANEKKESEKRRQLQIIRNERKKYRNHVETNKLMAFYLFVMLNVLVVYAMLAMWTFQDLTYLGVLITDVAAQILLYAIYCLKAYHGKKQEEDLKFKRESLNKDMGNNDSSEVVG